MGVEWRWAAAPPGTKWGAAEIAARQRSERPAFLSLALVYLSLKSTRGKVKSKGAERGAARWLVPAVWRPRHRNMIKNLTGEEQKMQESCSEFKVSGVAPCFHRAVLYWNLWCRRLPCRKGRWWAGRGWMVISDCQHLDQEQERKKKHAQSDDTTQRPAILCTPSVWAHIRLPQPPFEECSIKADSPSPVSHSGVGGGTWVVTKCRHFLRDAIQIAQKYPEIYWQEHDGRCFNSRGWDLFFCLDFVTLNATNVWESLSAAADMQDAPASDSPESERLRRWRDEILTPAHMEPVWE